MAGFDPKAYRATQAQQFSGTPAPQPVTPTPETSTAEKLFQPFQQSGLITADHQQKDQQSFGRKVGEDALLLGLAPSALAATAVDFVFHPIRETKKLAAGIATGFVESFDPRAWKEHPLINTINTVANLSLIGSIPKTILLNSGRRSLLTAARESAIAAGAEATIVDTVFKPRRTLSASFAEAVKTKSVEPLVSGLRTSFQAAGLDARAADVLARKTATDNFTKFMADHGDRIGSLDKIIHPLSALGSTAKKITAPIGQSLFGTPEASAVGKLYGSEVVKQDLPGFGMVEEWASMQVKERGLSDSVSNRVRIIQEWVDSNPEYAALTPLERNKHFAQYAEADLSRAAFSASKGREYVLTKALPKNVVEAMTEYISSLPKFTADGQPMTVAKIIESLGEQYGRDFKIHSEEVTNRMRGFLENTEREGLITAITKLTDSRVPVSLRKLTKAETKLVNDLNGSGYRIGRAPNKTKISQPIDVGNIYYHSTTMDAAESIGKNGFKAQIGARSLGVANAVGTWLYKDRGATTEFGKNFIRAGKTPAVVETQVRGKIFDATSADRSIRAIVEDKRFIAKLRKEGYVGVTGDELGTPATFVFDSNALKVFTGKVFSKEDLVVHRTALGRIVDKFGLSPEGVVEGTQFFAFREAFTQEVFKAFGDRTNITIGGQKFPIQSLSFTLERLRKIKQQTTSGVFPGAHTIADLRFKDLVEMGFKEADAKVLDKIIRESNIASPSITGLGEALSNYLRTRDNPLSRSYNGFLKWQSDLRFKKNPMFGMQAAVESITWGSLFTKTVPGTQFVLKQLSRIKGLETPLKNSIRVTTLQEEAAVLSEVMGNYNRQLRDTGMSPEIYRGISDIPSFTKTGVEGFAERARFAAQNRDSNIWLGAAGFSNVKLATNMMKAFAGRYGMTLDEALAYKMVGGKKVYQNQWLVENMQDAAQGIFGYQTGVLTSPLIRTLNTVFFPIRFQTKSVIQTAKWLESLSPASRLAVVNSWTSTASWLATDEGQKWKNTNRGLFASLFNYTFAYEGIGKTVAAVTRGQLFGGNTGLIGGLPFGFLVNIAQDLGYVRQETQINVSTGKPFKRTVVKDSASFAGFVTVVEDIILSMSPSMPFYTATGGNVTVSLNRGIRNTVEQGLSALMGGLDPNKEADDYQKALRKSKKDVKPGFNKLPLPF